MTSVFKCCKTSPIIVGSCGSCFVKEPLNVLKFNYVQFALFHPLLKIHRRVNFRGLGMVRCA